MNNPGKKGSVYRSEEVVNLMVNGGRTVVCGTSQGNFDYIKVMAPTAK
jgi:hypothetical protein